MSPKLLRCLIWSAAAIIVVVSIGEGIYGAFVAAEDHYFGSESMIGHGGWAYRSHLHYLALGVAWGLGAALVALVLHLAASD